MDGAASVRQPSFTSLAVLTLALGIGAATTIFSVIQNVLLDPFPYIDADRVVTFQIRDSASGRPGGRNFFQVPEFLEYQEQSHVFEDVIGGTPRRRSADHSRGNRAAGRRRRHGQQLPVSRRPGAHRPRPDAGRREAGSAAGVRDVVQDVGRPSQPRPRRPRPDASC